MAVAHKILVIAITSSGTVWNTGSKAVITLTSGIPRRRPRGGQEVGAAGIRSGTESAGCG